MTGLWISLEDRLPPIHTSVLTFDIDTGFSYLLYRTFSGPWRYSGGGTQTTTPDFWMPLPPPPTTGAST